MEKQSKHLIILLLALVALTAAGFGLKQYNKVQSETEEEETGEVIVEVSKEDVVKLSYDYDGVTYTFEKVDDTWYYADDHSIDITQYKIENMLSSVVSLTAEQVIEDVTNMSQYGLAEDVRTISFETENVSYIFEAGDYNSVSDVYYLRKPSENTVYAVESTVVSIFNKTLEDVTEEPEETEEESTEESTEEVSTEEESTEEESAETAETENAEESETESTEETIPE